MTEKTIDNIIKLTESIDLNRTTVEELVRSAGIELEPLVLDSVAKYWPTLERLASE
jgi:hypothetical protein